MDCKKVLQKALYLMFVLCFLIGGMEAGKLKVQAEDSEKKLYLEYLAKIEKAEREAHLKANSDIPENVLDSMISYKIKDLNNDGKKELIYTCLSLNSDPLWIVKAWVCTIQDGKVRQIWKAGDGRYSFYTLKGSKTKLVMRNSLSGGVADYTVYKVSLDKLKKNAYYRYTLIPNQDAPDFGYYKNGNKLTRDPFGTGENKLKIIDMKEYKRK